MSSLHPLPPPPRSDLTDLASHPTLLLHGCPPHTPHAAVSTTVPLAQEPRELDRLRARPHGVHPRAAQPQLRRARRRHRAGRTQPAQPAERAQPQRWPLVDRLGRIVGRPVAA
eukprot:7386184-Prymnesium_polylepis.1